MSRIARRWNESGIAYGVVHGAEEFPTRLGRDFDVLVGAADLDRARALANEVLAEAGWLVHAHETPWGDVWLRGLRVTDSGSFTCLEVDLLSRLQWACVPLAAAPLPESRAVYRDDLRLDPWAGFVKRALLLILSNQVDRLEADPDRLTIVDQARDEIVTGLQRVLGDEGAELAKAVDRRDSKWIRRRVPSLRRTALARSVLRRPVQSALEVGRWLRNEAALHLLPPRAVPILAVVGPDGVGKSSVLGEFADLLREELLLPDVRLRHWRPEVLPPLRRLVRGKSSARGPGPPRRTAGRLPAARLAYYGLDHWLGYLTRDRIAASRAFAVCYDRCLLDMAVDPLRFGLASSRGVVGLWKWLPKPDLVVLLTGDPEDIHRRKPELSEDEIEHQLERWRGLMKMGYVHAQLDQGMTPAETAREMLELYVGALWPEGYRGE